jgi:chemotaxis signal transduction protein
MAVAAGVVESVSAVRTTDTDVGHLLDLPRGEAGANRRALGIAHRGRRVRIAVDAPIGLLSIGPEDLLPASSRILERLSPVVAFARDSERILLLIDVARLLERDPLRT